MNTPKQFPIQHSRARVSGGFTLIELCIAMVIAAVLAAIAIPSYNNYVRQGRRADAKSALLDIASLEERYFTTNNVYSAAPTDLGYAAFPATVGAGYYQLQTPVVNAAVAPTAAVPGGTPANFSITALAIGDQANDTCTSYTLTSGGVQTSTAATGCW
jgi:type IV pilus assembly protein PilE